MVNIIWAQVSADRDTGEYLVVLLQEDISAGSVPADSSMTEYLLITYEDVLCFKCQIC